MFNLTSTKAFRFIVRLAASEKVWPITTQQVEKNRMPWTHPRLSFADETDTFIDRIFRPLLRAEKQCNVVRALPSVLESKSVPQYIRQASWTVAATTSKPTMLKTTLSITHSKQTSKPYSLGLDNILIFELHDCDGDTVEGWRIVTLFEAILFICHGHQRSISDDINSNKFGDGLPEVSSSTRWRKAECGTWVKVSIWIGNCPFGFDSIRSEKIAQDLKNCYEVALFVYFCGRKDFRLMNSSSHEENAAVLSVKAWCPNSQTFVEESIRMNVIRSKKSRW